MKQTHSKRLFVAVTLPPSARNELTRIQNKLKRSALCEGRYTNANQAHLTLVFIGSVDESELPAIKNELQTVSFHALTATVGSVGTFEKHGQTQIIYLDIICQELATLANLVAETLTTWAQKEDRPFVSHATIIRVKKVMDNEKLLSFIQSIDVEHASFNINSFMLMESELGPDGPEYHELARYTLLR